jgi:hypothetical protein
MSLFYAAKRNRTESSIHSLCERLMTVEQRKAGIVGHNVHFGFLVAAKHHDIFHDS